MILFKWHTGTEWSIYYNGLHNAVRDLPGNYDLRITTSHIDFKEYRAGTWDLEFLEKTLVWEKLNAV